MDATRLEATLREVLDESIGISGAVVATIDGLLVAAEPGVGWNGGSDPDSVSALASACVGVGAQFVQMLGLGDAASTVVQGSSGCAAVQRLRGNAILVVYGTDGPNVARLHLAARQAVPRIEAVLAEGLDPSGKVGSPPS